MEKTLIILKPDCVERGLVGEITSRFEKRGLKIAGMKMSSISEAILKEHYSHLSDKPFFPSILKFMRSSPVVLMVIEGKEAVEVVRQMCGPTNSRKAPSGTIRGDFSMSMQCNIIHASDSIGSAEKEIARFFKKEELFQYEKQLFHSIYSEDEIKG